jgi:hypothetical protein
MLLGITVITFECILRTHESHGHRHTVEEREASSRLAMECEEDKPASTVLKQMHSTFVLSTLKVKA